VEVLFEADGEGGISQVLGDDSRDKYSGLLLPEAGAVLRHL
jgi:hypothetical protein